MSNVLNLRQDRRVAFLGGTGREGSALALRFAAANWAVSIGSRDRARAEEKASELRQRAGTVDVSGGANLDVAAQGGLVFLCVPFDNAAALLTDCRNQWQPGTIVVDTTVPLQFDKQCGAVLLALEDNSGSERLAKLVPSDVPLVAGFKTIPAHVLGALHESLDCDVIICGDDAEARTRVMEAARDLTGLRPLDGGPLRHARALEAMCAMVIGLNRRYKSKGARFRVVGI